MKFRREISDLLRFVVCLALLLDRQVIHKTAAERSSSV